MQWVITDRSIALVRKASNANFAAAKRENRKSWWITFITRHLESCRWLCFPLYFRSESEFRCLFHKGELKTSVSQPKRFDRTTYHRASSVPLNSSVRSDLIINSTSFFASVTGRIPRGTTGDTHRRSQGRPENEDRCTTSESWAVFSFVIGESPDT